MALTDYRQDLGRKSPSCTCPAFQFSGYRTCKHLLTERRRITLLEAEIPVRTTALTVSRRNRGHNPAVFLPLGFHHFVE